MRSTRSPCSVVDCAPVAGAVGDLPGGHRPRALRLRPRRHLRRPRPLAARIRGQRAQPSGDRSAARGARLHVTAVDNGLRPAPRPPRANQPRDGRTCTAGPGDPCHGHHQPVIADPRIEVDASCSGPGGLEWPLPVPPGAQRKSRTRRPSGSHVPCGGMEQATSNCAQLTRLEC